MNEPLNIQQAIENLNASINHAQSSFDTWLIGDDEWSNPKWEIEKCFLQLLTIAEALGLNELHKMIISEYETIKKSKEGFSEVGNTPDGAPYPPCISKIRQFLGPIRQFFPEAKSTEITKDVLEILRYIPYTITDKTLFKSIPKDERDVHIRIEGILRCVYPDMKHKPTLTKPIKNFEPDTAIPSIKTLIEYKFLSRAEDVTTIADQVLADTRGYTSGDWDNFIYVIYETRRFRTEKEWTNLLRQSGVPKNTTIIVLSGEPPIKKPKRKSEAARMRRGVR